MSKLGTVLLVVAGLAVGLWLGFNPHAHQQVVQDWDHARTALVHMTTSVRVSPGVTTAAKPTTRSQPSATGVWKEITAAFDSLVNSLQRLWLNVRASISNTR